MNKVSTILHADGGDNVLLTSYPNPQSNKRHKRNRHLLPSSWIALIHTWHLLTAIPFPRHSLSQPFTLRQYTSPVQVNPIIARLTPIPTRLNPIQARPTPTHVQLHPISIRSTRPLRSMLVYFTQLGSIPLHLIPQCLSHLHSIPRHSTPRHLTPRHSIPHYLIPRHLIPTQLVPLHLVSADRANTR